jgi:hypothetical protein
LRDVRLALLPRSHALVEADVYFSPFISQRTPDWLSIDPPLAHALQKRLAVQIRRGGRDEERVRRMRALVERAHSAVPFEIALEERIIWISVEQTSVIARRTVNEALRDVLMRVLQGNDASVVLARWFAGAAKRMPPLARETQSFTLLVFASSSILGGRKIEAKVNATLDTFEELARYLLRPDKRVTIWGGLTTRGLHLRPEQHAGYQPMEVPLTSPVLLEARPENGRPILVQVTHGQPAFVPFPAGVVALRTLTRDLLTFRRRVATASPAEAVRAERTDAFQFDLFVSYSRRDNQQGRIRELVEVIQAQYRALTTGPGLRIFFDTEDSDAWEDHLLRVIRSARLLLVCLSPSYLESEYCAKVFIEYLGQEFSSVPGGEGIIPVYLSEIDWANKAGNEPTSEWVAELRRRQYVDFRSWFDKGADAFKDSNVRALLEHLVVQIGHRLNRSVRVLESKGNVDRRNEHFVGRAAELRRLRETVTLGKVGVITVVHGLGGIGKTALAIEYAHAFAHEYPGGCWQVRCEGREDLRAAVVSLAGARDLEFEFTEAEKRDLALGFERVLAELKKRAESATPPCVLLLLDNVDQLKLLEPAQVQQLPQAEWLSIIATTRFGEHELFGSQKDRAFLAVGELPESDALRLIEQYQPGGKIPDETARAAARDIVVLLGGLTLAVETVAVYLGQYAEVSFTAFRDRLKKEGLTGLESEDAIVARVRSAIERKSDVLKQLATSDSDSSARGAAIKELARGWKEDPDTLPMLKQFATSDSEAYVRRVAIEELARGWKEDPDTLPMLKQRATSDEDSGVRTQAMKALASFSQPEALPVLRELAKDEDGRVRTAVVEALASFAQAQDLPLLRKLANDQDLDVRTAAIEALSQFSSKLYVGNLSYDVTENDLQDLFASFGTVTEVSLIYDRELNRPRGFAFVTMSNPAEGRAAIKALNGKILAGRNIVVNGARERAKSEGKQSDPRKGRRSKSAQGPRI